MGVRRMLLHLLSVSALAGLVMSGLGIPVVVVTSTAVRAQAAWYGTLPTELDDTPPPRTSVLLAANGAPITYFYDEDRVPVALDAMSPLLRQAVVAMEDARFYEHGGVDPRGIARAVAADRVGGQVQGASTLTQQYVKNVLLENAVAAGDDEAARAAVERSATRKLREARLAVALEQRLSKDEILERYLNMVYFGGATYGAEAAARRYFSVPAADLDLPAAATLAGMIQAPAAYDPVRAPLAARDRRDTVLGRMLDLGMITAAQHDAAVAAPVAAVPSTRPNGCVPTTTSGFFCDFVVQTLLTDRRFAALGDGREARRTTLRTAGLRIRTTLDPAAQLAAVRSVLDHVPATDPSGLGAATAVVRPGTGEVLAMAQNRVFDVAAGTARTAVNYATDRPLGGATGFQTGSSFKPFTLAAWLEAGHGLRDTVDATPRAFAVSSFRSCGGGLRSTEIYSPGNAEGHETGSMSVLDATVHSVNVAYVEMERRLDLCDVSDLATRLGVHLAEPGDVCGDGRSSAVPDCLPSLTLGVAGIAPLTMAAAYASFADGGTYCRPRAVTEVLRSGDGPGSWEPVEAPGRSCRRAVSQEVAAGVTEALSQVLTRGTAAGLGPDDGRPAAGKTGTTDGPYDTWFVGYTPGLSAAVWVGDPDTDGGSRTRLTHLDVAGSYHPIIYGGTVAAPIWHDLVSAVPDPEDAGEWPVTRTSRDAGDGDGDGDAGGDAGGDVAGDEGGDGDGDGLG